MHRQRQVRMCQMDRASRACAVHHFLFREPPFQSVLKLARNPHQEAGLDPLLASTRDFSTANTGTLHPRFQHQARSTIEKWLRVLASSSLANLPIKRSILRYLSSAGGARPEQPE